MSPLFRNLIKVILFLGAGLLVLYLVYLNFNESYQAQCELDGIPPEECDLIRKVITDFTTVNYFWILLVFVAFILSNVSRTLKWKMLLEPMGYRVSTANGFLSIMLGYFANLGIPRMGEVVRCGVLARYEKVPLEKVMGTVFMDRATDMIMMFLLVLITLGMQYELLVGFLQENAEFALTPTGLFVILFALVVLVLVMWFSFRILKLYNPDFADKIIALGRGFLEGIKSIKKLRSPGLFIFHSFFIWLMYFFMTYLAFFSFAPTSELGLPAALMVFTLGTLGMLIPTPGGMGSFHYLAVIGLGLYGLSAADGFSFANVLFFSVQIGCNITLGLLALILLPIINKKPIKLAE